MYELTSAQYRFRSAVPEGDLYEALGLSPTATSLDVDVAGARLAEQVPSMAKDVSGVVNVLTHRQRRTLYDAVRKVREEAADALASRCGTEFCSSIPDLHGDLWRRSCRLFRFDVVGDEQKLGEDGRKDLASAGPNWIVYEFLDARVEKVNFAEHEKKAGRAIRDAWHVRCGCRDTSRLFFTRRHPTTGDEGNQGDPLQEFKATDYMYWQAKCPRCGQKYQPTEFDDRYEFVLADSPWRGQVIRGEPVWGGSPAFVVVGSPGGKPSPKELLDRFFKLQDEGEDATLRQAEVDLLKRPPVAAKPVKAFTPATSGRFPWWPIAFGMMILGNIARTCSHNDSTQYSPPQWKPPNFNSPDLNHYSPPTLPQWPLSSATAPNGRSVWTVPQYGIPSSPSDSSTGTIGLQEKWPEEGTAQPLAYGLLHGTGGVQQAPRPSSSASRPRPSGALDQ